MGEPTPAVRLEDGGPDHSHQPPREQVLVSERHHLDQPQLHLRLRLQQNPQRLRQICQKQILQKLQSQIHPPDQCLQPSPFLSLLQKDQLRRLQSLQLIQVQEVMAGQVAERLR